MGRWGKGRAASDWRRILEAAGLIVVAGCTPDEDGCGGGVRLDTLEFIEGTDVVQSYVWSEHQTIAWGQGELGPVPGIPLDETLVRWNTPAVNTEIDFFVRDPEEARQKLQHTWAGSSGKCAKSDGYWDLETYLGAMPDAHVIPWAAALGGEDQFPFILHKFMFAPGEPSLEGPASVPDFEGSVKAVRAMWHRRCSNATALAPLLGTLNERLWDGFVAEADEEPEPDRAIRHYSHAISYLAHTEGVPGNARGGFFLDFFFELELDEAFTVDIKTCFNANYLFTLGADGYEEGILQVIPQVNHGRADGTNAEELHAAVEEALEETVPEEFAKTTFDMQTRDILPEDLRVSCVQYAKNNCENAANLLAVAIDQGGIELGLPLQQRDRLAAAANEPLVVGPVVPNWYTGLKNWRCMAPPEDPNGEPFCQYVLRAINAEVYPDQIELIWYDRADYDNPVYALAVAAQATDDAGDTLAELCNYDQFADVPFGRRFARDNRGHAQVNID
jgi:hypothetical protein